VSWNPVNTHKPFWAILVLSAGLCYAPAGNTFNFGDMMSPGKWFGGHDDDDYEYDGPYGYGAPPYGPPPPPYGYGAPGFASPYGYGQPPMGTTAPGYGAPPAGQASGQRAAEEIKDLEQRIRQLEEERRRKKRPSFAQPAPAAPGPLGAPPGELASSTGAGQGPMAGQPGTETGGPSTFPYPGQGVKAHNVMDPSKAVFRPWGQE
jgi:hypothetical protein